MGLWIDSGGKVYRTEPYTMECGPYRGKGLSEVPVTFLLWAKTFEPTIANRNCSDSVSLFVSFCVIMSYVIY